MRDPAKIGVNRSDGLMPRQTERWPLGSSASSRESKAIDRRPELKSLGERPNVVERQPQNSGSASMRLTRRRYLAAGSAALVARAFGAVRADAVTLRFLQEWGK